MGSSPKTVAAPDPIKTAQAQGQANIDAAKATAEMNRYDEKSPFGNTTWSNNNGKWTSEFQMAPELQGLLDQVYKGANTQPGAVNTGALQSVGTGADYRAGSTPPPFNSSNIRDSAEQMKGLAGQSSALTAQSGAVAGNAGDLANSQIDRLKNLYGQEFNYDKLGAMPSASDATRKAVEDAYYKSATSRLDPQFQQQEAEMRSRLANQGLTEGSEAYNRELQQFNMGRTDAYGAATNSSIMNSTSEMAKQFQMEMAARQQGVGEQNYVRELGTKEAQAAMGLYGGASGINNSNQAATGGLLQGSAGLEQMQAQTQSQLQDAAGNRGAQAQAMDTTGRANQLNEMLQLRGLNTQDQNNLLNTLMALRTGAQVQAPGAGQVQVGAAPVAQSIYNSQQIQQDAANAKAGATNSTIGTLGSLAGTAMMATSMF